MSKESFFGKIKEDYAPSFYSEFKFKVPHFERDAEIILGNQYDEDGEDIETPPTDLQLAQYERTFKSFLDNIDNILPDIQQSAFEYYKRVYAKYYEKPFEDIFDLYKGTETENDKTHPPLCLDTKEKHFEYMKKIINIQIVENQILFITIHYSLDTEHGLGLKIANNKVVAVDGIGEIYYA
jgi:hypothetical protein